MTSEMYYDPADELRRIIAQDHISEDALQAITGIQAEKLRSFLNGAGARPGMIGLGTQQPALSSDEIGKLSVLTAQLTERPRIGDDERLKAIFESLTIECHLTLDNLAQLTGLDVDDLEGALRDPSTVSIEKKYGLAIKGSYLINAINRARDQ